MDWTQDARVLYQDAHDFYPPKHWKSGDQQLLNNSMARLIIILSVLYSIVHKSYLPILGGGFALCLLAMSKPQIAKVKWPPTFETTPPPVQRITQQDDRDVFIQALYPNGVRREMDFSDA